MTASRNGGGRIGPGDVDDLSLLPKRFDFFVSEVRDTLARIERKLDAVARMEEAINDLRDRMHALEKAQHRAEERREREARKAKAR